MGTTASTSLTTTRTNCVVRPQAGQSGDLDQGTSFLCTGKSRCTHFRRLKWASPEATSGIDLGCTVLQNGSELSVKEND
jgi:hypothetical protein